MSNITLEKGFTQVCVWLGTVVADDEISEMVSFFKKKMGVRVQYLESIVTGPDSGDGAIGICGVAGTGGRVDVFLAVHDDDIAKFALARLGLGIRWIEDIYGNGHGNIYPARIADYISWPGYKEDYCK